MDERDAIPRAVGLMVASTVLFGLMAVCIRLASSQLHPFEIAFFRNLFGFAFTLPLLARHGWGILRTDKLSLYFLRCCIGIVSMLAGFWAIVHLPLAQAIALSYSAPIFVTIGAVLVLGEIVRARRRTPRPANASAYARPARWRRPPAWPSPSHGRWESCTSSPVRSTATGPAG